MTYRPNLGWPIPFLVAGGLFVAGGIGICVSRPDEGPGRVCFGCCFAMFGAFFALAGAAGIVCRISVDATGMRRAAWCGLVVNRDSWEALRSWTTGRMENPEIPGAYFYYAEFDFAGRRSRIRIDASLVASPGFDTFLKDVRSRVGAKEAIAPNS
jgi:hypothetical protein